ncbi:MAG: dihydropteroate synthase [Pseudomonadota bacterium]
MSLVLAPIQLSHLKWTWSRTCVVGVVNVTPDSFYDGGKWFKPEDAISQGLRLAEQGADVLDIGGESTRPGSRPVSDAEELDRILPVIQVLASQSRVPISVDTYKAKVAKEAVEAGACIVNDISGMKLDSAMAAVVAETKALVILGHLRGQPRTMQQNISFVDVVAEVIDELKVSVRLAVEAGVAAEKIWIDPGIGFGKTSDHSLALLREISKIKDEVGYPILVGPSRKSFIGEVTGLPVEERLLGTCAAAAAAIMAGVDAIRIHDVGKLMAAIKVADAIRHGIGQPG